jgi:hypothetical protein
LTKRKAYQRDTALKVKLLRIGVGKAFASPPSEPCWRFSRTRLSSRWFPHRGCLARYQTVDCVNSKKLREGGYSPPLTPLPAPTPCVSSAKRLRLAIVQVWLAHRLASLPRMALRHCRNYLASCQTSRIQLPTFLPIGAVLLAAPLTAQKRHRCYEGSDSRRSHTVRRVSPLTLPCLPNIQPPTTLWARVSLSQSSQRTRRVLRPRLRHE